MALEREPDFTLHHASEIRWHRRGSCGEPGCPDPLCCCSLCGKPIGVPEDDPRWETHLEDCSDCDLCRDQVPIMLWRGEGCAMDQAQFHIRCFEAKLMQRSTVTLSITLA